MLAVWANEAHRPAGRDIVPSSSTWRHGRYQVCRWAIRSVIYIKNMLQTLRYRIRAEPLKLPHPGASPEAAYLTVARGCRELLPSAPGAVAGERAGLCRRRVLRCSIEHIPGRGERSSPRPATSSCRSSYSCRFLQGPESQLSLRAQCMVNRPVYSAVRLVVLTSWPISGVQLQYIRGQRQHSEDAAFEGHNLARSHAAERCGAVE